MTELLERDSKSAADPSAALVERITRVLLGQGPPAAMAARTYPRRAPQEK